MLQLFSVVSVLACGLTYANNVSAATVASTADAIDIASGGYTGFAIQSITATTNNFSAFDVYMNGGTTSDVNLSIFSDSSYSDLLKSATASDVAPNTFAEFVFDPVETVIGDTYFFRVDSGSLNIALFIENSTFAYDGGSVVSGAGNTRNGATDLVFNASTDPTFGTDLTPVPLPSAIVFLVTALGGLFYSFGIGRRAKIEGVSLGSA